VNGIAPPAATIHPRTAFIEGSEGEDPNVRANREPTGTSGYLPAYMPPTDYRPARYVARTNNSHPAARIQSAIDEMKGTVTMENRIPITPRAIAIHHVICLGAFSLITLPPR
jgi:hypothetical protein